MVTTEDVRRFLKELPQEYVSDDTIELLIDTANFIVNKEKSEVVSAEDIEKAVLLQAAYLTLCAYASEVERSLGTLSPALNALIDQVRRSAELALQYVRRGLEVKAPYAAVSDSLWEVAQSVV
jgi:hypothetical protein